MSMRFGKIFIAVVLILVCVVCFGACSGKGETEQEDVYYDVTFDSAGGTSVEGARVLSGSRISVPEDPVWEGHIFNGWLNKSVEWDFDNDKVTDNTTLTASWINAESVFEYDLIGEDGSRTAILKEYTGSVGKLRVPTHIKNYPVTGIGDRTFEKLSVSKTEEIIVGENITSIGNYAFSECVNIKITLECKPTSIGERAFYNCMYLEEIALGKGVEAIPTEAFMKCEGLVSVVLSDTVRTISENAFEGCTALRTLTAHGSLKTVGDSAFLGCSELKAIYYYGTAEQWAATEISEGNNGNDALIGAAFYMYSETEPAPDAQGKYWYFKDNGSIRIW